MSYNKKLTMKTPTQLYQPKPDLQLSKNVFKTSIDGLYYINFKKFHDDRGFFSELTKVPEIDKLTGNEFCIKQINCSYSKPNVIRGMHAENWNKLITVVSGVAFCALADIRPESPTFGKVETFKFSITEEDGCLSGGLYVSSGIANSICALKGFVGYMYGVDKLYEDRDPAGDKAISIFDPDLNIPWPVKREEMIISQRDVETVTLREMFPDKFGL